MNEINWTIFSRDKSCQLELLLRSTKEYYKEYNTTKINNPCNKVQTNNPNRHGNISAEYLNQEYLKIIL